VGCEYEVLAAQAWWYRRMKVIVSENLKHKCPKNMTKFLCFLPFVCLLLSNCGSKGITQQELGTITGKVYSTISGVALSNVSVSCGGVSTKTDVNGAYTVSNVPVGRRTVTASKEGYELWRNPVYVRKGSNTLNIFLFRSSSNGDVIVLRPKRTGSTQIFAQIGKGKPILQEG